jgi:hypothetical protein
MQAQSCKSVLNLCSSSGELFNKQSLARSYKINPNQKLRLIHLFYSGIPYQLNVCKEDSLGDFSIRLLEYDSQEVLWDNTNEEYITSLSISFGVTQRVLLEIQPHSPEKFKEQSNCVGVIVRYHQEDEVEDAPPSDPF